jgi:hypothetical protein
VNDNITVNDVLRADIRPNLSLIPAKVDLYAADIELVYIDHHEFRLKRILDTIKDSYGPDRLPVLAGTADGERADQRRRRDPAPDM